MIQPAIMQLGRRMIFAKRSSLGIME